jgi:hypothetical protein
MRQIKLYEEVESAKVDTWLSVFLFPFSQASRHLFIFAHHSTNVTHFAHRGVDIPLSQIKA